MADHLSTWKIGKPVTRPALTETDKNGDIIVFPESVMYLVPAPTRRADQDLGEEDPETEMVSAELLTFTTATTGKSGTTDGDAQSQSKRQTASGSRGRYALVGNRLARYGRWAPAAVVAGGLGVAHALFSLVANVVDVLHNYFDAAVQVALRAQEGVNQSRA